ncbi:Hypothetical predicted protein [Octopus vulgaris]|uniref:Uncharacterized protein n=1 Tax=Octopus vulgaris TaxID=6645 RepID=A0AA36EWP2_OCTVU|nr:Hypothetical predicted protein [Octopus vulgaris]
MLQNNRRICHGSLQFEASANVLSEEEKEVKEKVHGLYMNRDLTRILRLMCLFFSQSICRSMEEHNISALETVLFTLGHKFTIFTSLFEYDKEINDNMLNNFQYGKDILMFSIWIVLLHRLYIDEKNERYDVPIDYMSDLEDMEKCWDNA